MKKVLTRTFLILSMINFGLMIWFAQYIVTGWIIYLYVVGSLALMCVALVMSE